MIKYTNVVIILLKTFHHLHSPPSGFIQKNATSHGSTFVTWYHHKMSCQGKLPWCEFTLVAGVRISLWYEISQRYHVNANWPHVSGWNQSADRLEWVAHAQCLRFWITYVFHQLEVYLQISRYEMTQSLCKRDTKWKSHPAMKLALVRVFSCKNPLRLKYRGNLSTIDMIWQHNLHNQQLSNEIERPSICMDCCSIQWNLY